MRYMAVPQTGQLPFVADLPFFIVTWAGFCMSRLVRHLRQYACIGRLIPFLLVRLIAAESSVCSADRTGVRTSPQTGLRFAW